MFRFAALTHPRTAALRSAAVDKGEVSYHGQAALPHRPAPLRSGHADLAEQVVSDVMVMECLLHCGSPWRRCGIPADDPCLLAMQGALPAVNGARARQPF
jgi:hypothetical protein